MNKKYILGILGAVLFTFPVSPALAQVQTKGLTDSQIQSILSSRFIWG